jgi:hypothetical protein
MFCVVLRFGVKNGVNPFGLFSFGWGRFAVKPIDCP